MENKIMYPPSRVMVSKPFIIETSISLPREERMGVFFCRCLLYPETVIKETKQQRGKKRGGIKDAERGERIPLNMQAVEKDVGNQKHGAGIVGKSQQVIGFIF